jgi:hypothetical protein
MSRGEVLIGALGTDNDPFVLIKARQRHPLADGSINRNRPANTSI